MPPRGTPREPARSAALVRQVLRRPMGLAPPGLQPLPRPCGAVRTAGRPRSGQPAVGRSAASPRCRRRVTSPVQRHQETRGHAEASYATMRSFLRMFLIVSAVMSPSERRAGLLSSVPIKIIVGRPAIWGWVEEGGKWGWGEVDVCAGGGC